MPHPNQLKRGPIKRGPAQVGALLFGILVALGLTEILLRAFNLAPQIIPVEKWRFRLSENPKLSYEPIPHLGAQNEKMQYYLYPDTTNSLGFRGRDPQISQNPQTPRIIVLGDSVVTGIWVSDPNLILTHQLELALKNQNLPVEVYNFGVPGYNTYQEAAMLEDRGIQLKPNIVILVYCPNDIQIDNGGITLHLQNTAQSSKDYINLKKFGWLFKHSALFRTAITYLPKKPSDSKIPPPSTEPTPSQPQGIENVKQGFKKLKELSQKHQFEVVIVPLPDFELLKANLKNTQKTTQESTNLVHTLAQEERLFVFDPTSQLETLFLNSQKPPWIAYDKYHLTPEGHAALAKILAIPIGDWLKQNTRQKNKSQP